MSSEEKMRITKITGTLMVLTALVFDFVNFLFNFIDGGSFSGWIITTAFWTTMTMWLWIKGVYYTKNSKIFMTASLALVWGLIPVLNALPEYSAAILRIIYIVRNKDDAKSTSTISKIRPQKNRRVSKRPVLKAPAPVQNTTPQQTPRAPLSY
jgi:hypothetical protein